MTARDTICQALAMGRYAPEEWIDTAQAITDALKADGYVIVELPPVTIQRDTYSSWLFTDAGEVESVTWPAADNEIAVSGIGSYTPAEARGFAEALLAAAAEADPQLT